ncbi:MULTISPECIES: GlxA family transcriptional regulator [Variovorax]|jgi:transcriptional regulator GlxA family with amidase domain|uniref:GlxA family transcriptional regulator n=1 Tax=Variovorax TaxID=34072 RepID=UPI0008687676|nr:MULTISPECIES: GlxA family transcriptional regulator [Variovorax]MBN8753053.1 GlxA family transcriptional regulator [Variovorax sp.]ODU16700.1 MAG: AraC family transcriptional regulator [Variovorax sp. SCN 67-85]ODV23115.1 MAG: AraC family transcriptional regulator [Variovorax sp. SCN 67-20]OJZ15432.1 MAG: AraC family transcriptional regulator [Variovorax sp. 67-131]UKI07841.1 GlxA family transcriptional regulator [Variovorax paradoxus]
MKRIGVLVFPGFQILDLAAIAAFELANMHLDQPVYCVEMLSETGGPVVSSSGVTVDSKRYTAAKFDTLVMTGSLTITPTSEKLCQILRSGRRSARRVASICTGAFGLADAGLLDGRRVTTHWAFAQELQRCHPLAKVQPDRIFINDDSLWTSAGMTAGIDLVLALVEEDLGVDMARLIAKKLVVYHRRAGGQSQFSALLELEPKSDRIQLALAYARAHLREGLSVEELAEVAHLSPRQFSRAFKAETGQSPAQAVESLRVEAARALIDEGRLALGVVAQEVGFGDPERMRRAFLRTLGQPPQSVRRVARQQAMAA